MRPYPKFSRSSPRSFFFVALVIQAQAPDLAIADSETVKVGRD